MELSKRLSAVAGLVTEGASVADIGTDHAYIPIYLAEHNKSSHIIAMDINRGPLEKAKEHIAEYGLESVIQTKLSDVRAAADGEVMSIAHGLDEERIVRIRHDDASEAIYGNLASCLAQVGDRVYAGDVFASILEGEPLAFELRVDGRSVDPTGKWKHFDE